MCYPSEALIVFDVVYGSEDTSMDEFELLVRSILLRADTPAVLILGHFSPQVTQTRGFAGVDHWHSLVAHFYDVPHVRYALFIPSFAHDLMETLALSLSYTPSLWQTPPPSTNTTPIQS